MNTSKTQPEDQGPSTLNKEFFTNFEPKMSSEPKKDEKTGETLWGEPSGNKMQEEEDDDNNGEGEFEVEEILEKKVKRGTGPLYLVKWKGFSAEEATWEPRSNLENAPLKIQEFENKLLLKKAQKAYEVSLKGIGGKTGGFDKKEETKENGTNLNKKVDDIPDSTKGTSSITTAEIPETILGKRARDQLDNKDKESSEKVNKNKKEKEEKKNKTKASETKLDLSQKPENKISDHDNKDKAENKDDITSKIKGLTQQFPTETSDKSLISPAEEKKVFSFRFHFIINPRQKFP